MTQTQEEWKKRLNGYFIAFCRKIFRWSPAYRDALKMAFIRKDEGGEWYKCRLCGEVLRRKDKQMDHIQPVVKVGTRWSGDWNEYRDRLFVESESLQVLCKKCHQEKSKKENKIRRENRQRGSKKS